MKHSDHTAGRFPAILLFWTIAVCLIPNVLLSVSEGYGFFAAAANILLPGGVYAMLAASTRRTGRSALWMFVLMFFAAFQIVLLSLFGRSVIAVDMLLNVLTTNATEVGELLGNMLPVIALVVALYLPPLAAAVWCECRRGAIGLPLQRRTLAAGGVCAVAGLMCLGGAYMTPGRYSALNDLYPVNVGYNIYLAFDRTVRTERYHATSAGFTHHAVSTRPADEPEIYVAVVGETSRAPQWSIFGYNRPTSAALDSVAGLYGYAQTISESNTTHKSVPMLLSSLNASSFADSIYLHKGIISAFREAGFRTMFISNQARNHSFIDFFGEEADSVMFINEGREGLPHHYDHEMLPMLDSLISHTAAPKQLYVLHCYGSHFSYPDRYPAASAQFRPDSPVEVTGRNNERLINAYDNTIVYTSQMLADLAALLDRRGGRSAFIYTSDHGEDIFDDERGLFLHASPVPSYHQLHVPMLVWLSADFRAEHPGLAAAAAANRAKRVSSSDAYFHTLMQIAGLNSPYVRPDASLVSPTYAPKPPLYLDDHNESLGLESCGLQPIDFEQFRKAGISF